MPWQSFWPTTETEPQQSSIHKLQGSLIAVAIVVGFVLAFFPTEAFIDDNPEPPYYIIPKIASAQ